MKQNLDVLMTEIERYLEEQQLAIFYGYSRALEPTPSAYWDSDGHPDYKMFVKAASTAGVKLMLLNQRVFSVDQVDDALEQLGSCDLPRDEYREFQRQLEDLRECDGAVGEIELSFDHAGRTFLFELRTQWYEEFTDLVDEIQVMSAEEETDDPTMGGYFSRN